MKHTISLLILANRKIRSLKKEIRKQHHSLQSLLELNSSINSGFRYQERRIETLRDHIASLEDDCRRMTERDENLMVENNRLRKLVASLEKELEQYNHTS